MAETALIAMSGGVDSSVAALLMVEAGYDCIGVTLNLAGDTAAPAAADAHRVAERLGISHVVLDCRDDFAHEVIEPFVATYEAGETPNPCVGCNRTMKFARLLACADEQGIDIIATGHYARTCPGERVQLLRGADPAKDQSYVLSGLTQDQLVRVRFPLGALSKQEVRQRAAAAGLANADSPDSQDVCFIADGDHGAFIERWRGVALEPGEILDTTGSVIGHHRGLARYTIGQRKGLEVAAGHPVYVVAKDVERNIVTLGEEADLFVRSLVACDPNWVSIDVPTGPLSAEVKISYRSPARPARVTPLQNGRLRVDFDEPVRAAAPGQAVVAYDGDRVICGATIADPALR
ncbi:MAG: tRNA 2-thiouridine(34) synthase MnmA [Actinomycetia bacterium]|nr:tRNA 2-thiouridine(34) synthase MnmA [Actinomycetes bacterium]